MKKKLFFTLIFALCAMIALGGCSGGASSLTLSIDQDGRIADISADGASEGDFVMSGTLEVGENDKIVISQEIEADGSLTAQFIPADAMPSDEDADTDELAEAADSSEAELEAIISGTEPAEYFITPGSYYLRITADGKTSGTATISVESGDPFGAWTGADSAEAAAEGAGIDSFIAPDGTDTSLGAVSVQSYHYKEGSVMAYAPVAAVELQILKGINGMADVSVDGVSYANKWTKDVNGQEVTCYGNREGEATKTAWTNGDYNYAILAYGAGGDDDFGLSEQDMIALVMTTK